LLAAKAPVVLAGDFNVVPTPQDIYHTKSLDHNALIQPASRAAFASLLAKGWTDSLRRLQPEGSLWTFWDYEYGRWPANKGMRLDHLLLSPCLCNQLVDGGVDVWVRGEDNASDHAPAWIELDVLESPQARRELAGPPRLHIRQSEIAALETVSEALMV